MPRIRQYVSQAQSTARVNTRAQPMGLDLSGVMRAADAAGDYSQQLQQAQDRARVQLEHDEAVMTATNAYSEAQMTWTERLTQAKTKAPADAAGFTSQTLADFDAWTEDKVRDMPEAPKKILQANLRQMRLKLHADSFQFETSQRNKALVDQFGEGLEADRRAVMADPNAFADTLARRRAAAESLSLPAETRGKLADHAREALASDAANALIDLNAGAFLERAGARAAKGAKGKQGSRTEDRISSDVLLSSMRPDDLRRSIDRASMIVSQQEAAAAAEAARRQQQAEAAAARRDRAAAQGWSVLSGYLQAGMTPNASSPSIQAAMKAVEGTPYAQAYRDMLGELPQRQAAAVQPLTVQQQQLDALVTQRNVKGASPELDAEIKRREQVLAAGRKAFADEPLSAAAQFGHYSEVAPLDTSSLDAMLQGSPMRVQQAEIAAQYAGRPVSPFTTTEGRMIGERLGQLQPAQKAEQIAKMAAVVPPQQLQALARDVDKQDKPLALALAAGADRTTQGRTTAELILRGAQIMADAGQKAGQRGDVKRQELTASLRKLLDGTDPTARLPIPASARNDIIEAAVMIDAGLNATGSYSGPERALRLALHGDIVEHNGQRIVQPAGVDVAQRLNAYPEARVTAQTPDGYVYIPGGRPMGVPEFLANLPAAQLEPAGLGRYYVRSGGGLVMNRERAPIVVDLR